MRRLVLSIMAVMVTVGLCADIKVSDVEVFSGYPWKEVVVGYTITGTDARAEVVRLTATDKSANKIYTTEERTRTMLSEGRHVMRWNAAAEGVKFSSANVVFVVEVIEPGVQLWANGPYWAEYNVGATKPEEYGYYFWWGDTVGYKRVGSSWNAVDGSHMGFSFSSENCPTVGKDDVTLRSYGYIDWTGKLATRYDAATKHWGTPWRMPTSDELDALSRYCTTTWTTRNGVRGRLVTGLGNYASKSIFLPAAGYCYGSGHEEPGVIGHYWSSTPARNETGSLFYPNCGAWHLELGSYMDLFGMDHGVDRFCGLSVRPLR